MKKAMTYLFAVIVLSFICTLTVSITITSAKTTNTIKITAGQSKKLSINKKYLNIKSTAKSGKKSDSKNAALIKKYFQKSAKKYTWKSSDKKVATVSGKGIVTGLKKGKTNISATLKKNRKIKLVYKVKIEEPIIPDDLSEYEGISKTAETVVSKKYIIDNVYYIQRTSYYGPTTMAGRTFNTIQEIEPMEFEDSIGFFKTQVLSKKSCDSVHIVNSKEDYNTLYKGIKGYFDKCSMNAAYGAVARSDIGLAYQSFDEKFFEKNSLLAYYGSGTPRQYHLGGLEGRMIDNGNKSFTIEFVRHTVNDAKDMEGVSYNDDMINALYIAVVPKDIVNRIIDLKETSRPVFTIRVDQQSITADTKVISGEINSNKIESAIKVKVNGNQVTEKKLENGFYDYSYSIDVDFSSCKPGDIVEITREYAGEPVEYSPVSTSKQFVIQ